MSKLYISMYHYTRDIVHSRYPQIKGLDTNLFRQQIEYMKNNFNIVTMEQVIDAVEGKSELSEKALLLTFDDGYIDNYTFAFPILEEFGIQGSFFIPGKTFTTHQLLDVNKIHCVGFTTEVKIADICMDAALELPRLDCNDFPPKSENYKLYDI